MYDLSCLMYVCYCNYYLIPANQSVFLVDVCYYVCTCYLAINKYYYYYYYYYTCLKWFRQNHRPDKKLSNLGRIGTETDDYRKESKELRLKIESSPITDTEEPRQMTIVRKVKS